MALVRQWRLAADEALLEIPAGGLDVADDGSKEDPERAARRELEEETGMRAGSWRKLAEFYSAPGFTDELMHLYLATDLTAASADGRLEPDEDERLILEWRAWQDAVAAAENGEIRDAKSIVGLFWLARVMDGSVDEAAPVDGDVAHATYRMTQRELVLANVEVMRRSTFTRVAGLLMSGLSLFGILTAGDLISVGLLVVGLSFLTGWFAAPIAWYQARKRPDLVTAETVLRADDRGLRVASPMVNGLTSWAAFRTVHESGRFLFLDTDSGLNLIIPKRVFAPGDLAILYRLLERHGLLGASRRA